MALKRAYADIILNTAKEAAARIMVSERKAMRYQKELFTAKEDALRMLLRLKQMLDTKVFCLYIPFCLILFLCFGVEELIKGSFCLVLIVRLLRNLLI